MRKPRKTTLTKIRKQPGKSNAYKYSNKEKFAGPDNTYPLTKNGKPSLQRGKAILKLAHNSPKASSLKAKARAMYPSLRKAAK